jgi:hypothetical protein
VADFNALAAYDAEVARGIVHTPEWDAAMASLRVVFEERVEALLEASRRPDGAYLIPPWWPGPVQEVAVRVLRRRHEGGGT